MLKWKRIKIEHGMYLLALIMLEGYNSSRERDIKNGIYNPIANGRWNYEEKKNEISRILNKAKYPALDSLLDRNYENYIW